MCRKEFDDLLKTGRFSFIPGTLEEKWFAESAEHAQRWGEWFEQVSGTSHAWVVEVEIDDSTASKMRREAILDGIGPARCAKLHHVKGAKVRQCLM